MGCGWAYFLLPLPCLISVHMTHVSSRSPVEIIGLCLRVLCSCRCLLRLSGLQVHRRRTGVTREGAIRWATGVTRAGSGLLKSLAGMVLYRWAGRILSRIGSLMRLIFGRCSVSSSKFMSHHQRCRAPDAAGRGGATASCLGCGCAGQAGNGRIEIRDLARLGADSQSR